MTANAFRTLTRHFVTAIVEPPILTDLGVDTFRRTLIAIAAAFVSLGLFLPRVFYRKYADLSALPTPDGYLRALPGDTLLMIVFPMLVTGLAAIVVSPMLFPDETDYCVLTPLPLRRAELFAAKLAALAIVAAAGVLAVNGVMSLGFPAFSGGRWAVHGLGARIFAHAVATMLASAWMVTAVMALQGVCLLTMPAAWRHRFTMALQAGTLVLLLVSMPLLFRLAGRTVNAETVATAPQIYLPPIWFLGVERWLLDGTTAAGYARAAGIGGVALAAALAIVAGAFARLFRSAEILAGTVAKGRRRPSWRLRGWLPGPTSAVAGFALRGLTRNRLQQFVFLIVMGWGLALLVAQLATISEGRTPFDLNPRAALNTAIAAPLLVALCATLGMRSAFLLPLDRGAGWIFRVTDDPRTRPAALDGVTWAFGLGAIVPAHIVALALQPPLIGASTLPCLALTTLAVLALVEIVLVPWRRIPYTCSYLPGKRHLTYTLSVVLGSYIVFVAIGSNLLRWSSLHPARTLFTGGLLLAAFASMRRARLRTWGGLPLQFEDEDPNQTIVIALGPAS